MAEGREGGAGTPAGGGFATRGGSDVCEGSSSGRGGQPGEVSSSGQPGDGPALFTEVDRGSGSMRAGVERGGHVAAAATATQDTAATASAATMAATAPPSATAAPVELLSLQDTRHVLYLQEGEGSRGGGEDEGDGSGEEGEDEGEESRGEDEEGSRVECGEENEEGSGGEVSSEEIIGAVAGPPQGAMTGPPQGAVAGPPQGAVAGPPQGAVAGPDKRGGEESWVGMGMRLWGLGGEWTWGTKQAEGGAGGGVVRGAGIGGARLKQRRGWFQQL